MKSTIAMLAVLLFVTTMAVGQNALPFPQAANPALASGAIAVPPTLPSAMAANTSAKVPLTSTSLPFPMAGNPSLGFHPSAEASFTGEQRHAIDNGSPFPMAADPSQKW